MADADVAHWGEAGRTLGSTLVVFSRPSAFAESLEDSPGLWDTAVRRGAEAGRRARGKRKRAEGDGAAEVSVPAPVAVLLMKDAGKVVDEKGALCELLEKQTGMKVVPVDGLPKAGDASTLPGPTGLLIVMPDLCDGVLAELTALVKSRGAEQIGLQEGCTIVLTEVPLDGLAVSRPDGPPHLLMGLQRDEKDKKDVLSLVRWDAMEAKVKEALAVAEVAGLAVPSTGAAVFYPDGCVEAFQEPLVRLLPKPPPDSKAERYERLDEDCNALRLPQGFAPHESPYTVAAAWIAEGGVLAFTGAGTSKESGVPTYRDGNGLWKRYDAMEVSSIAGMVGEPAKVWDFEKEFNDLLRGCKGANPGHYALAELEKLGCVDMVVTQNVDGFHQSAGSRKVVELHGSEVHAICLNSRCGQRTEMSRIFGHAGEATTSTEGLWSASLPGWGIRWPERPEDTKLQKAVRQQLTDLKDKALRKKSSSGKGSKDGKSSQASGTDSDGGSSSSSSSSGTTLPRQCEPKALTEQELAKGCPPGRVPICPVCSEGILKPDGIFFGEALERPVLKKSLDQSVRSNLVLMVGTSGQVDPAAKLPLLAKVKNKAKIVEVNLRETRLSKHADLRLLGGSAEVLPRLQRLVAAHPRTAQLQALREAKARCVERLGRKDPPSA